MFSAKKMMMKTQDGCPRRIESIGACRILDENGDVMGFTINWRVSDGSRESENGIYRYIWQPCAPFESGGCNTPYEIVNGTPVQNWTFESPQPNPDGSFSKTVTFSKESREYSSGAQQELFNLASRIDFGAGSPTTGTNMADFGNCWNMQITVNC